MSSIVDPGVIEQVLQGDRNDKIIALPGEPIVNIDAVAARRKVNGYLGREISMMMMGTTPALVYSEDRLVWRVPILITSPFRGQLGVIGVVDVDVRTSELIIPLNLEATLHANANAILKDSPYTPES